MTRRVAVVGGTRQDRSRRGGGRCAARGAERGPAGPGRVDRPGRCAGRLRRGVRRRAEHAPRRAGVRRGGVNAAPHRPGCARWSCTRWRRRTSPRCRTTSARPRAEDVVRRSGLAWTILQPGAYLQNLDLTTRRSGCAYRADAPFGFADLDDVAEAAATVLTEPGHDGATVRAGVAADDGRGRWPRRPVSTVRDGHPRAVGGHRRRRPRRAGPHLAAGGCSRTTKPTDSRSACCRSAPCWGGRRDRCADGSLSRALTGGRSMEGGRPPGPGRRSR